ncbi:MAG TPA: succinate dehydrogenase, hydrophobic membrane anchor protein [Rhodanobacteraceae bacterium]|nr:succinate dehydrogenase, hydrophobic membrane anchor protein [Rhodanobacteraceae bacterium]
MSQHFRTPIKVARGLGSAQAGSHHFMVQRLTAVALIALGLWFVWIVLEMLHMDYAAARALIAKPWNAVLMVLFVIASFWHAQLGLQVILEDYVHAKGLELASQIAVKFACLLGGAASVLAVVRIALGS